MTDDLLHVYLIHWGRPQWCCQAVQSLQASAGVRLAITVVDNGSPDGSRVAETLPDSVRVLTMPSNRGYTGAANQALEDCAGASFCVIASHDLHVRPETLRRLLDVAVADPTIGIAAPALTSPFGSSGGRWTGRRAHQLPLDGARGVVERDWASGSCLLIRQDCAHDIGGFDESFGSYVEDVDFCLRARDDGWRVVVVTDAQAWGLGTSEPDRANALMIANAYRLTRKRLGTLRALPLAAASVLQISRSLLACLLPRPNVLRRNSWSAAQANFRARTLM
ncbi:MAG: glycosyltransferase, partial [Mycobacteriales bacterium]